MEESVLSEDVNDSHELKSNKKSLIEFAKLNKHHIFVFIGPVFCFLTNYFFFKIINEKLINEIYFFNLIIEKLNYVLAGLFYFIIYCRKKSNKEKESNQNSDNDIKYIYNESLININTKKIIFLLIIISIIVIIDLLLKTYKGIYKIIDHRFYYMIFIPLFSKFILKDNIYKHHYLSLAISIIGWVIVNIPIFMKINAEDLLGNLANLVNGALFPLILALIKYLNNKYYISPFKTSLIFGLISIILSLIGFMIYSLIKYHNFTFFNAIFDFSKNENKQAIIIYFVLTFFFWILLNICILSILSYFSPILILITEVISPFLSWIEASIEKRDKKMLELIICPIGYSIILFSSLIYNELFIFNCCGLNTNTKKFVNKRIDKELLEMNKLIDEDE